ncbi:uncharacterized protein KY384_006273 [Bacidia gigantensis]|uniref:uncharacterized protein n=1 Tax=Bacidia gigantensis TaxID=2732470 RepID=UPI001D054D65|nr:uncharacterized protein KY384_006273 [Bacidia gigantensis]KAG8528586.1 hypothetical protein KY384_006273 [Bacidia gigantensis]
MKRDNSERGTPQEKNCFDTEPQRSRYPRSPSRSQNSSRQPRRALYTRELLPKNAAVKHDSDGAKIMVVSDPANTLEWVPWEPDSALSRGVEPMSLNDPYNGSGPENPEPPKIFRAPNPYVSDDSEDEPDTSEELEATFTNSDEDIDQVYELPSIDTNGIIEVDNLHGYNPRA